MGETRLEPLPGGTTLRGGCRPPRPPPTGASGALEVPIGGVQGAVAPGEAARAGGASRGGRG
eukprot:10034634-Alexandrium_andersonii.AAC.1